MDSCYSLPFLLKCYERLGGVMSVCPLAAAARRRRGVLARAAYAMRKARYADNPRLPLARAGSIGNVLTLSPAPPDVSQGARARSPDSEPRRKKRRRRRRARPARGALPPRHVLYAAELGDRSRLLRRFHGRRAHFGACGGPAYHLETQPPRADGVVWRALPRVDAKSESRGGTGGLIGVGGVREHTCNCVNGGSPAEVRDMLRRRNTRTCD